MINNYAKTIPASQSEEPKPSQKGMASLWPTYIVGKTVKSEEIKYNHIADDPSENGIYLKEVEYTTYYTDS
jgi:hypothetical protein